jgi:putative protease
MMNKPELLAPAGSMDSLRAAVDNGADAVYLGVGAFHARANAQNFEIDKLQDAVQYAHIHSVLVYLTLNTLLRDDELPEALQLAQTAYDFGVDAVIVQDIGLIRMMNAICPHIPLHASTQMNIFDSESYPWAMDHHISRIVLPRELSVDEIRMRTMEAQKYGIDTEVFVHGALCVSYSGLCLFSAMNGNGVRSGNRGLCAQPCRTRFSLLSSTGGESQTTRLLSPKDQCGLPYVRELMKAGVRSFKIEGRMREPSYVAVSVRSYREYIDAVSCEMVTPQDEEMAAKHLLLSFNRGGSFTTQYLQGVKRGDFLSGDYSGRYGLPLGVIVKRTPRTGIITVRLSANIIPVRGDYLSIRTKDAEVASFPVGSAERIGDVLQVKGLHPHTIEQIEDGAIVYMMSETDYTKELLSGKPSYKTPVSMILHKDNHAACLVLTLTVTSGIWKNTTASFELKLPENELSTSLPISRISDQLSKSKSSPFDVKSLDMDPEMTLSVPISFLNELRREAFQALEHKIIGSKHASCIMTNSCVDPITLDHSGTSVDVRLQSKRREHATTNSQLPDAIHVNYFDLHRVLPDSLSVGADFYSFSIYDLCMDEGKKAIMQLHKDEKNARFLIWLPGASKDIVASMIAKAIQFMQDSFPSHFAGMIHSHIRSYGDDVWISPSANLYNTESLMEALSIEPFALSLSYECKDREILSMISSDSQPVPFGNTYLSLHRYGRIEWMQSEFCPVGKHAVGCRKCDDNKLHFMLRMQKDEDNISVIGKTLPVITHAGPCTSEILGPLHPSAGADLITACREKKISVAHSFRFLDESHQERLQIIQSFNIHN